jgi:PAS domain S-box-containing protein
MRPTRILPAQRRLRAEREALRRSETLLSAASALSRTGAWEIDLATRRVHWTQTVHTLHEVPTGFEPTLEQGMDFYVPEHRPLISAAVQRAMADGTPFDLELQLLTARGRRLWVRSVGGAVHEGGRIVKLIGIVQDIEERKHAEQRHRAEQERLRFLDTLHQATRDLVDPHEIMREVTERLGRHLAASRCGWTRFDWTARTSTIEEVMEVPGLPVSIRGSYDVDVWGARLLERLQRGQTVVMHDIAQELAGEPAMLASWQAVATGAFVATPVLMQGQLHAMLAVDNRTPRQWTEAELELIAQVAQRCSATIQRALAEAALRRSEAALREAQRVAGLGSFELDVRSQRWEWSDELRRICGLAAGAAVDLGSLNGLFEPATATQLAQALQRVSETGEPFASDGTITLPDGTQKQLHLIGRAWRGPQGHVERVFGTVQDVSARVRTEARLRAALGEKEVLLREIYHRVKNNLQVVSSLLMLQSRQPNPPEVMAPLADSANRIKSMALVHEQLYQQGDLSSVDFARYLAQLAGHLGEAYADVASRVAIRLRTQPVPLGIETAVPLGLVVNELLSNAFKHAYPDGRSGEVLVRLATLAGGVVELEVRDNGVGLPAGFAPEALSHLGMQLVSSLAQQLEARLLWPVAGVSGARFILQFVPEPPVPARLRA